MRRVSHHEASSSLRRWVPYVVLGVTLMLSAVTAFSVAKLNETREKSRFDRVAEQTHQHFQQVINGYFSLLDGLRGLVNAGLSLSREQFFNYLEPLRLREDYPGVQGLGIAIRVPRDQKEAGIQSARKKGNPTFHIWPEVDRDLTWPVVYLAPPDDPNNELIGFDLYAEPAIQAALARAVETASPTASGRFLIPTETNTVQQAGFLICVPVFLGGKPADSHEERLQKIFGFLVCLFRVEEVFRPLAQSLSQSEVDFAVYSGPQVIATNLLFKSQADDSGMSRFAADAATNRLTVAGQPWTLVSSMRPGFSAGPARYFSWLVMLGGIVTGLGLFGATLAQARAHDLVEQSAEARRQAEAKFRRLVEQSIVGIYVIQGDRFVYVNPKMEDIFGCTQEELTSRPIYEFISEESRAAARDNIRLRLQGKVESIHYSLRAVRKDGRIIDVEAHGGRSEYNGESAILGCLIDITERKQAEREINELNATLERRVMQRTAELEAANRELDSFCHSVSHDLRSPLRGIDGFAHLLADEYSVRLDDRGRTYLTRVLDATRRMDELVVDLLNLSRVTRSELIRRPVNLSELARRILDDLKACAPERVVEVVLADDVTVEGDARLLRNVLENLLGNAWKFTARKSPARIEFGKYVEPNGRQVCFIRDNGAGFDMKYAAKLFGAFQRLHAVEDYPGTGVGLATVQRIINRHGGRIWVEAKVNEGAAFFFTL